MKANIQGLILSLGVVGVLGGMILPLPPFVIDVLLAANLIFALLLILTALYIDQPIRLSALPTILLLATLFRLSLNISTTRLILSGNSTSEVIQAFGDIVVDGNVILGLVLFLVITLVQFIVIAKGAERVAEVSARFSLDALPGRQMSIDADVRSGLIDFATAAAKRSELQVESRFYGALDGAMKFVKGDAIVGIIITAINIIGGLAIGVLVLKLDMSAAVYQFSLLSIGDGLLSQIPALLNSLAAGIVVTRVARDDGSSLATDVLTQVGCSKREVGAIAIFVLLLAISSSMPVFPFVAVLGAVIAGSLIIGKEASAQGNEVASVHFEPAITPLLELRMSKQLVQSIGNSSQILSVGSQVQSNVYAELGLLIEPPKIDLLISEDEQHVCQIYVHGVLAETLQSGAQDVSRDISDKVIELIWSRPVEFIDDIVLRRILDEYEKCAPELVANVVPALISVTKLTRIVKLLVGEGIAVHNFDVILQALAEHAPLTSNERELLIEVRIALGRMIVHSCRERHFPDETSFAATPLDPEIDVLLSQAEAQGVELHPSLHIALVELVQLSNEQVIVTSKNARRFLFEILSEHGIRASVLCFDEIPTDIAIVMKDALQLDSEASALAEEVLAA